MQVDELTVCPGTLAQGFSTYSPGCLRQVFNGRKVSHILPYFNSPNHEASRLLFVDNRQRISISGVQLKLSLLSVKNKLRLTHKGEQGSYILKPIPHDLRHASQVPANEHLTMQIAKQVYKLNVAENALVFFKDGIPAYLTKRFDIKSDGTKYAMEDFASLAQRSSQNYGPNYKYDYSYEQMARLIKKFVPAWRIEIEKFYSIILFNYLFSNGDAHLKNFSLLETDSGDYFLSPAYDLVNTSLHIDDNQLALDEGLFADGYETESFKINGYYAYDDFYEFALKIGIAANRIMKILNKFTQPYTASDDLIKKSFLNETSKKAYHSSFKQRLKALNYSYKPKK